MSQLIQLRQRLKAVETIKKITSAMRIISRSLHTRMNKQKVDLNTYQEAIKQLLTELQRYNSQWNSTLFFPNTKTVNKLFIIVGAQKGLCGNYNAEIEYIINNHTDDFQASPIITIGKKTTDLIKDAGLKVFKQMEELKNSSLETIAQLILKEIIESQQPYSQVTLISSQPESFFVHKLQKSELIPFKKETTSDPEDYLWQNNPNEVLDKLGKMYLQSTIYATLFMSLLGEQSARFIAMDNATRNADNFIDSIELQYNKLRQAKITRELTELTANFKI